MRCPVCKTEVPNGSSFCFNCGAALSEEHGTIKLAILSLRYRVYGLWMERRGLYFLIAGLIVAFIVLFGIGTPIVVRRFRPEPPQPTLITEESIPTTTEGSTPTPTESPTLFPMVISPTLSPPATPTILSPLPTPTKTPQSKFAPLPTPTPPPFARPLESWPFHVYLPIVMRSR